MSMLVAVVLGVLGIMFIIAGATNSGPNIFKALTGLNPSTKNGASSGGTVIWPGGNHFPATLPAPK